MKFKNGDVIKGVIRGLNNSYKVTSHSNINQTYDLEHIHSGKLWEGTIASVIDNLYDLILSQSKFNIGDKFKCTKYCSIGNTNNIIEITDFDSSDYPYKIRNLNTGRKDGLKETHFKLFELKAIDNKYGRSDIKIRRFGIDFSDEEGDEKDLMYCTCINPEVVESNCNIHSNSTDKFNYCRKCKKEKR